ncbi:VOC family protein [Fuscibacter oryzae]|uniref:VOC family protein n=1 Tax=Fuscibacter oryzae TaxID=2803939 RepID=A0A8J7MP28_9RHOB|nr:VOC family protein [Fuscibacter oryzae]MBL4927371.1 VOC family protein [Fuscibacter oryzae]
MTGLRLAAITLIVPDYDIALAFYCENLGFDLIEDIDQGRKRWVTIAAPGGGSHIVLARADTPAQQDAIGNQGAGRVWLFLQTDDIARDQALITNAGAVFEEAPRHESYGIVAVWRDPFGNRWDLIQPG